jgi:hypothetical protein
MRRWLCAACVRVFVCVRAVGAIAGAGLAKLALPSDKEGNLTVPTLPAGTNAGEGFLMEVRSPPWW